MDEHGNADRRIIDEARRIAAERGVALGPYQRREIFRLASGWIDEGMGWREATRNAVALVLPLHAIEDAPWK